MLCVSVDIDSVAHYLALYGEAVDDREARALTAQTYGDGVRRFLELFEELGVPGTFFAVGRDLEVPAAAQILGSAAAAGHELGNHTWSHPYDLIHRDPEGIREEITRGHGIIADLHAPPVGFRAPGYNTSDAVLTVLRELGYRYDASPLPSWPYLAAKYAVMAGVRLRGRRSASIFGDPGMGLGRTAPWEDGGLLRIPCAVTRWTRLPVIGTSLVALPARIRTYLVRDAARRSFISLELHAVDLMDVAGDRLPAALARQKDLTIPWRTKRRRIEEALRTLLGSREPVTLAAAAARVQGCNRD
ncbi:MAG: polysaccharide deacetylase family protein [Pseudomonadota bacterium]